MIGDNENPTNRPASPPPETGSPITSHASSGGRDGSTGLVESWFLHCDGSTYCIGWEFGKDRNAATVAKVDASMQTAELVIKVVVDRREALPLSDNRARPEG